MIDQLCLWGLSRKGRGGKFGLEVNEVRAGLAWMLQIFNNHEWRAPDWCTQDLSLQAEVSLIRSSNVESLAEKDRGEVVRKNTLRVLGTLRSPFIKPLFWHQKREQQDGLILRSIASSFQVVNVQVPYPYTTHFALLVVLLFFFACTRLRTIYPL